MTEHSSTAMLNCGESKKYCHTVIFAGILEMNATLRSQAKYRGVAVKFLLEVGRLRLAAIPSAPPCAAPYRAARETGGCSRVESCVSAASQECLHHHWSPATAPSSRTSRAAAGLLSRWSWQRQRLCSGGVESAVSEGRLVAGRVSEGRRAAQVGARSRRTCRAVP